jgi:hypothetical protein
VRVACASVPDDAGRDELEQRLAALEARLAVLEQRAGGPGTAGPHRVGQLAVRPVSETSADVWVCTTGGEQGAWRKLAGPGTVGALHLLPVPVRVYDTRPEEQPPTGVKAPVGAGLAPRVVDTRTGFALGTNGVAAAELDALAVLVTVTVARTTGTGYLAAFRNGIPWPGTSSLNWFGPEQTLATTLVVALDDHGCFALACGGEAASAEVVVDVVGYYR